MKIIKKLRKYVLVLLTLSLATAFVHASEEADVYFNAGTEKYLQGNFTESIENLEKAQSLNPANTKVKGFMIKILLEAATQNHLTRNYRQAYVYLEKAKKIDPENTKVLEMHKLTGELLNPTGEKSVRTEQSAKSKAAQELERAENTQKDAALIRHEPKKAPAAVENAQASQKGPSIERKKESDKGIISVNVGRLKEWHIWLLVGWALFSSLLAVVVFIMWVFKFNEAANYRRQFAGVENDLKNAIEIKNESVIDLEKIKEREKYQHETVESLQKELKEIGKKEEKRMQSEIELKTKEIETRVRKEIAVKYTGDAAQKDNFVNHQQERFMKYVSDTSVGPEADTDPVLASARDRIALMAQNLYEFSPVQATDFITKMAKNQNPAVRTNIVQALASIAKPEMLDLLCELYEDTDPRVKREVLRNMKLLNQKLATGVIELDNDMSAKIKYLMNKEKDRGEWIF